MNIDERLSFFQEMISCNYPVYLWNYDNQMRLLHTNSPKELITGDMVALMNYTVTLLSHVQNGRRSPLILDTNFGIMWLAAFEFREAALYRIHLVGPAFSGRDSHLIIKRKLDSYNISVRLRAQIFHQIDSVPIIPTTTLIHMAVMLHFAVTGEKLSSNSVEFATNGDNVTRGDSDDVRLISEEHRGIWLTEQALLKAIREGSPDYKDALLKSMSLSTGVKMDTGDSLRRDKNNALVLLTLCSRASMDGGLNPSIAYSLNDYYATRLELCRNVTEVVKLNEKMLEDYVSRVRQAKLSSASSTQIQNSMDYIALHLREPLSIKVLAEQAGYTEYYFSHKFKQHTGYSVSAYIRMKKIEEARLLLSGTTLSVQEISDELNFGSRNYFYTCFQKAVGVSPTEYREKYLRR